MVKLRAARESDHPAIISGVHSWWSDSRTPQQSRELAMLLPRLFLQHFASTSLVAYDGEALSGFLVGFYSADDDHDAYIHFAGVDPALRRQGLARRMYATFFDAAAVAGRRRVRAVTSPANRGSIAFHAALGFTTIPGPLEVEGTWVHPDYDGPGQDLVRFTRELP